MTYTRGNTGSSVLQADTSGTGKTINVAGKALARFDFIGSGEIAFTSGVTIGGAFQITGSGKITMGGNFSYNGTSGWSSGEIDFAGYDLTTGLQLNLNGITVSNAGNITVPASPITFSAGTINITGNVTTNRFLVSSGSGVKVLNMGNGVWTLKNSSGLVWDINTLATNLTINPQGSTINATNTGAGAKTMRGGGATYNDIQIAGASGAGTFTFLDGNTFNEIILDPLANVRFTLSTTTTVIVPPAWTGTSGNLITVASSSGSTNATLSVASGTVSCDYINLTRITASGSTPFYAGANSTDGGNNTNWTFTAPPSGITGDGAFTLGTTTVAGTAAVKVQAAAAFTLAAFSLTSAGTVKVQAAAAITLAALSLSATASALVKGTGAFTLDALTLASTASVKVQAAAGVSLAAVTIAGAGAVKVQGDAAFTLGDLTAVGSIGFSSTLDGAFTLAPVTIAGAGAVKVQGASSFALAALSATGTGQIIIKGDAAITLGPVFTSSAAVVPVVGNAAITLEDMGLSATASVKVQAHAAVELESALFEGTGAVIVRGAAAITLNPFTVSGSTQKPGTVLFPESLTARVFRSSALGGRSHKTSALQAVSLQRSEIGITIR